MAENLLEITDSNFEDEILKAGTPALIDFWASWCAPCRAITPIIEELAKEYKGKVSFGKMDVDANPKTPAKYSVRGIPMLILFKDGEIVDQIVGSVPKSQIKTLVEKGLE